MLVLDLNFVVGAECGAEPAENRVQLVLQKTMERSAEWEVVERERSWEQGLKK